MGTPILQLPRFTPTSLPLLNPTKHSNTTPRVSCGSHRKNPGPTSKFGFEDGVYGYDEFEIGGSNQRRTWWEDNNDDYDDEWDDFEDDEIIWFWVFKIISTFGWMVPAVTISLLLGTGPTPFLMALAVPLGQTALSLVFDKVWGSASSGSKFRSRAKARKKPYVRYASTTSTRSAERKREETNKKGEAGGNNYQSWVGTENDSNKKHNKRAGSFGGWDELDGLNQKVPPTDTSGPKTNSSQKKKSKMSRTGRVKDTPLLVRLLIAVFPFLGSWTRFLF